MKSKLRFDLGDNNREVIFGHVIRDREDVRDRIAYGFVEGMGYDSHLCFLRFFPSESGQSQFEIYPVNINDVSELVKSLSGPLKDKLFIELRDYLDSITIKE